jgi:hypothetical protein
VTHAAAGAIRPGRICHPHADRQNLAAAGVRAVAADADSPRVV